MNKPEAWLYEEYDTNGKLRARHVWNLLPNDLSYLNKLKDVGHVEISALDKVGGYDLNIAFYGEDTMTAKRIQHLGKIVFNMYMVTTTSPRRLEEQGVISTTWLYLTNYFSVTFKNKSTTNDYKDFR